jgi:hypothetical protein
MVLSISACGNTNTDITIQALYDATNIPALLEKYDSVYFARSEDGDVYEEQYYSKEYRYISYDYNPESAYVTFSTDHSHYIYYMDMYMRLVVLTPDGMADMKSIFAEEIDQYISSTSLLNDTITSVTKKGDQLIVTSVSDQEELDSYTAEGWTIHGEEHVIDAKTHELISAKSSYTNNETGETYGGSIQVTYGGEIPESMKKFVEYDQQTENLRTVTIVSNPGAANEKTESLQVPKGLQVACTSLADDYEETPYTLYTDAACTQTFEGEWDVNSDLTIYVKWTK